MTGEEATIILEDLVRLYVNDTHKRQELLAILALDLPSPPVRGLLNDIYINLSDPIAPEDRDRIADLIHYFG
ncbi:hypothetical protein UCD39_26350 [Nitrospirillum sp. BR 11752]|uniref:Uncharacterized protein n=1 Tax=Nitrospirillum amazonense TaxID=28077 RepID=A0A560H4P5_9PROT|nr:hypothetical protein [Nitrospirillum amazonense]MEE3627454.1 hypothetical protein [Nitrospirillum sp. BR 11752]TWB41121.1 hypothetical protein FBZ90_108145 [Nitrospirillum amazonense]